MTDEKVMSAIRELREHLALNQVSFSVLVGKSYPSIQRYERQKPPQGVELAAFYRIANEASRTDLAMIFRDAALDELPSDFVEMVKDERQNSEEKAGQQDAVTGRKTRKRA